MIQLETKRLIIRDHKFDDLINIHQVLSNKIIMNYLPDIYCKDIQCSLNNLKVSLLEQNEEKRMKFFFAIEKKNAEYIGEIGFTIVSERHENGICEIGYFLKKDYWNNGYATEATKRLLCFAFQDIGLNKIIAGCLKENVASERVMIKCNLIKEAEFKEHIFHEKSWKDKVQYRLLKREWEKLCEKVNCNK
jgi:[ribosomal protein S5]-alanine N-acetyltransferase